LAFLQTFLPGPEIENWRIATGLAHRNLQLPPDWPTVFKYEIEYADGKKLEIPVRFGESIEQWYRVHTVAPMLWVRNTWTKDINPKSGEKTVVYAMKIPNPRPTQTIKSISILPPEDSFKN